MSASDSGLILVELPVVVAVGAVSLAVMGIAAAAEKYRQFRFDQASVEEMQKKAKLDFINGLADANREEYEAILRARADDEASRKAKEEELLLAAQVQLRREMESRAQTEAEIHLLLGEMDEAVARFEAEFGEEQQLRDMAETIRYSRRMFGDGAELLQELNDLLFVVIPGMAQERREQLSAAQLEARYNSIASQNRKIQDTSKEFVSLHLGNTDGGKIARKTPWQQFVERIEAVAELEALHFESDAAELLEQAQAVAPDRRNFFLQQNQSRLQELEERAEEYRGQQALISEQTIEDYCSYLAMAGQLGIEARYTRADLTDAYTVSAMRAETQALAEEFKKRKERQYTANAFSVVMKRHNLTFENMSLDENGQTHLEYAMDQQAGVRITRSASGAFEMQFQGTSRGASASMDEQRSITEKAKHFCSLLPSIVEELKEEFGITFEQTALQPPDLEHIEIKQSKTASRVEAARTQKAMQMKL